MTQIRLNSILEDDISQITDETTKQICQCALIASREALIRGESNPSDFVSKELDRQLTRILRGRI